MICEAGLSKSRGGGASVMPEGKLDSWISAAQAQKNPDPSKEHIFVNLIQLVFELGELEKYFTWVAAVLLPKGWGK